jgi:hypothetical protein
MFSRTACFVAASVFAAMGPAAAQVRPQGAPAAQEVQPPQRKDRQSRQHQFRRARRNRDPRSRRLRSQNPSAALRAKIDLNKTHSAVNIARLPELLGKVERL